MTDSSPCTICGTSSTTMPSLGDYIYRDCPRCGKFILTGTVSAQLSGDLDASKQAKISGWIFDRNRNESTPPKIDNNVLGQILTRPIPTVAERAERLLLESLRGLDQLGDQFKITDQRFIAATYSQSSQEVDFLFRMLSNRGLVKAVGMGGYCEVLLDGYNAAYELTHGMKQSEKGFVAMAFDESLRSAYENGFHVGIVNAGYDPVRVDRIEHVNRIDDEIISQIKAALFVVADFTGHRGGVYFEAGFALGSNMPVIWTCRKDDMAHLHFDIRQYNTIDWETPEELALRLQHRIEVIVGKGPKTVLDS